MIIFINENNIDKILEEAYNSFKYVHFSYNHFTQWVDRACDLFIFSWGLVCYDKELKEVHIHVLKEFRGKWRRTDFEKIVAVLPKPVTGPIRKENIVAQNLVKNIGFRLLEVNAMYNVYVKE